MVRAKTAVGWMTGTSTRLNSEQATHPIEGVDHRVEAVGLFSEQGLGPANGLRRRHLRGLRR